MSDQAPLTPADARKKRGIRQLVLGGALFVGLPLLGSGASAFFIARGFGDVAAADPAEKARLLAESISEAMNCTAAGALLGVAFGLPLIVMGVMKLLAKGP